MQLLPDSFGKSIMLLSCSTVPFVHSSGQILLPRYLMNSWISFDKLDREYLLAPTDDW